MQRSASRRSGITLVETLVLLLVGSVATGALVPSFGTHPRTLSQQAEATNQLRQFMQGWKGYAARNDGMFPGLNSSGLALINREVNDEDPVGWVNADGSRPMQHLDWFSPSTDNLPAERIRRWRVFFDDFADPAMGRSAILWRGSGNADEDGLRDAFDGKTVTATSWLAPHAFSYYGDRFPRMSAMDFSGSEERFVNGRLIYTKIGMGSVVAWYSDNQATIAPGYAPRFASLANASNKVALTTGTRYFTRDGVIDWDSTLTPSSSGAFNSAPPVSDTDNAFGRGHPESQGRQLKLAYRHSGNLLTARFDGSVVSVSREQSFDPTLWYPTGSVFNAGQGTAVESLAFYKPGQTIN